jgi:flagellar biosynthesis protein FlhF
MNIQRFHAATSREALGKARAAFGDGTLILSNRPTATGVEVVATAEDALTQLADPVPASAPASSLKQRAAAEIDRPLSSTASRPRAVPQATERNPVQEDTEQLAMSTLSFQDYVRERMLRRRHEALNGKSDGLQGDEAEIAAEPAAPRTATPAQAARAAAPVAHPARRADSAPAPAAARSARPIAAAPTPVRIQTSEMNSAAASKSITAELQAMKDLIEDRFNTLTWLGQARQDPIQSNLMLKMIRAGFSPALARAVLERLPQDGGAPGAVRWLMDVLERNLRTAPHGLTLSAEGGIFAMVGATGVGKTTTAAKLAAQCARLHGPASVGLITLDTYRIAAHEQLRSYGRMLGVVAHLAHDRAALQDLLGLLANKKMVLIDTTGVAPRDPRKRDMLDVLDLPGVQRLLVLNAGNHGDTIDDVVGAFKTSGEQQVILSKTDEAVKLGPALDALIRHQLVVRGVTNGQRVPEDWEEPDAGQLVRSAMRAPTKSAYDPKASDLNFFFSTPMHDAAVGSSLDA